MNQPKIVLCQHAGTCYAEYEGGRHGARGTGTTEGEALLSLMEGSQSVIGVTIEREASFMPAPSEAVTDCELYTDARYDVAPEGTLMRQVANLAKTRPLHVPPTEGEMAELPANFAPKEVP